MLGLRERSLRQGGIFAACCALWGRGSVTTDAAIAGTVGPTAAVSASAVLSSCDLGTASRSGTTNHGPGTAVVATNPVRSRIRLAALANKLRGFGRALGMGLGVAMSLGLAFGSGGELSLSPPPGATPGGIELLPAALGAGPKVIEPLSVPTPLGAGPKGIELLLALLGPRPWGLAVAMSLGLAPGSGGELSLSLPPGATPRGIEPLPVPAPLGAGPRGIELLLAMLGPRKIGRSTDRRP